MSNTMEEDTPMPSEHKTKGPTFPPGPQIVGTKRPGEEEAGSNPQGDRAYPPGGSGIHPWG